MKTDGAPLPLAGGPGRLEGPGELTCGNCRFWHKIKLANDPRGECRFLPPQVVRLAIPGATQRRLIEGIGAQVEVQIHEDCIYPKTVPAYPACSQYQATPAPASLED